MFSAQNFCYAKYKHILQKKYCVFPFVYSYSNPYLRCARNDYKELIKLIIESFINDFKLITNAFYDGHCPRKVEQQTHITTWCHLTERVAVCVAHKSKPHKNV